MSSSYRAEGADIHGPAHTADLSLLLILSSTITAADFRGLRKLARAAGKRFAAGVALYDGETSAGSGDSLYAVPIRALWEKTAQANGSTSSSPTRRRGCT